MKKYIFMLVVVISLSLYGCASEPKTTNVSTLNSKYNEITVGMDIDKVKTKLGEESIIFKDGSKESYVWSTFRNGENEISITFENGKVVKKEMYKLVSH